MVNEDESIRRLTGRDLSVLVALYEEPEKPANALDFIKQYLGAPTGSEVGPCVRPPYDL